MLTDLSEGGRVFIFCCHLTGVVCLLSSALSFCFVSMQFSFYVNVCVCCEFQQKAVQYWPTFDAGKPETNMAVHGAMDVTIRLEHRFPDFPSVLLRMFNVSPTQVFVLIIPSLLVYSFSWVLVVVEVVCRAFALTCLRAPLHQPVSRSQGGAPLEVVQLQWLTWPDRGAPIDQLKEMDKLVNLYFRFQRAITAPVVVQDAASLIHWYPYPSLTLEPSAYVHGYSLIPFFLFWIYYKIQHNYYKIQHRKDKLYTDKLYTNKAQKRKQ